MNAAVGLVRLRRAATGGLFRGAAGAVDRPAHVVLGAAVLGLVCGPGVPALAVALAAAALVGAVVLWRLARAAGGDRIRTGDDALLRQARLTRAAPLTLVVAAALAGGAGVAGARAAALDGTTIGPLLGRAVVERVTVEDAPRRAPFGGWSARVRLRGEPVLLRVRDPGDALPPEVGSVLRVQGELRRPGEFARLLRLHAELRGDSVVVAGRRGGAAGFVDGVRRRSEAALERGLPPAAAGLLRGMVLGQDAALPEETREAFRTAGLSHLVAASGTNVALLAALAMVVGTAMGLGLTGRLWLVLALVALYVPLAGGGASIQRAGIMGAAAVLAALVGRGASRWYALWLAAAVTLVLDPNAVTAPGWQLSFVAVLSLLLLAPGWRTALVGRGLPGPLADVIAMTAAATVATAPVVALHFGETSLVGLPANVLAAPAVAPVMWLGVIAAALGQLAAVGGPVGGVVGVGMDGLVALAGYPLGYLVDLAGGAAAVPDAALEVGPVVVGGVAGGLVLLTRVRRAHRCAPAVAVLAAVTWVGLAPAAAAPAGLPEGLRVTFLDVGQGDATLVQDGGTSVLFDAGPAGAGIAERLRAAGVEQLDLLVATHASADHEGGAAAVLAAVEVRGVLDGRDGVQTPGGDAMEAAARARGVGLLGSRAGQVLRVGALRLRVLWPPPEPRARHADADPNARATVVEVEARGARVLLTADAESEVLSRLELRRVDVLKVSHHGSADPGLPRVLERLRPRVAGIEVGAGNTYGHPAPSTLTALRAVPVLVRTDRDGSVRLDLGPDGWEVRPHA